MRSYRAEAIVLRRVNVGETDRILTLFTRDRGKLSAIAKGSRRITSSLSGATELCSYSSFQIALGTNLDVVTQAELKNAFLGLRANLDRISRALYVLEFCAEFIEERQPHSDLFDLLLSALYSLGKAENLDWVIAGFELQAISRLGYAPQLTLCVSCGQALEGGSLRFSAGLGGVLCPRCAGQHRDSVRISPDAIATILRLAHFQLPVLGSEEVPESLALEVRKVIRAHVRHRAEKESKSAKFVEQIRAQELSES